MDADADIVDQLHSITRCRRCECRSCQNGYENHSHGCTDGPHRVETREKLRALEFPRAVIAGRAQQMIRDLREANAALKARVAQLEALHSG